MRTFLASLNKDVKLTMRNWHTILSFMVLPFILIVVIGYIFGTNAHATITVGFDGVDPSIIPDNEEIVPIDVASCEDEFSERGLDACIAQQGTRIEVFIDNSKTNLYAYTISLLQQAIEEENEQAAITSISALRTDLESQLDSIRAASTEFASVEASIREANASIGAMLTSFNETSASVEAERASINRTKTQLEGLIVEFDTRADEILERLDEFEEGLDALDANLTAARENASDEELDIINDVQDEIDESESVVETLRATIETVSASQNIVLNQVVSSASRFDGLLASLDNYSDRIEDQRALLDSLARTAEQLEGELESVENGTQTALGFSASEILRSVNAKYTFYYDLDIRLIILPMVTMMILVFLSTVIASLLTYQEITSPAMDRVELSSAPRWMLDISKLIVIMSIVLINVLLMYVIALLLWDVSFLVHLPMLILISVPAIVTFALIGSGIAYLIRRPFVLFVSATFISMVFIVASGILRPSELLDPTRAAVVINNPAAIFLESTRLTILGAGSGPILGFAVWLVVGVVFLSVARRVWHRTVFRD